PGKWTPFATSTITFGPTSSNPSDTGTTTSTNSTNSTTGPPTNLTRSPTPIESKPSKGVPTGIVVGVGIGTALVGAFLALLGVWLFLRQSRRSRPAGGNSSPSLGDHVGRFGGAKNSIGKGLSTSIVALDDLPFDPVDDSQTRKSMQDLYELIHQHAENHYNAWNFEGRREDLRHELAKGGWNDRTEQSAQTLASLLVNPTTRRVAIRHIIAWAIIQHIDLKSSPDTSLLPAHIKARNAHSTYHFTKAYNPFVSAFSNSFPKWRHLTAALLSPLSSRTDNSEWDSILRPGIIRNLELLNGILRPFIKSGKEAQLAQSENLASIIFEGAHFGYLLFSQPAIWVFRWDRKNLSQGGSKKFLVVFPGIGKLIVRDGSDRSRVL
ncbi:hypothetical protein BGZ57DRAFT_992822, partial [Hyaloscypha finlandica]